MLLENMIDVPEMKQRGKLIKFSVIYKIPFKSNFNYYL